MKKETKSTIEDLYNGEYLGAWEDDDMVSVDLFYKGLVINFDNPEEFLVFIQEFELVGRAWYNKHEEYLDKGEIEPQISNN